MVTTQRPLSSDATPTRDMTAVPASAQEVGLLVEGLQAEARTPGRVRTRGYSRQKATQLLIRLGAAGELGHWSVPITAYELQALDCVAESLWMYRRSEASTQRFANLLALLAMRLGQARIRGCEVSDGAAGLQWVEEPNVARFAGMGAA